MAKHGNKCSRSMLKKDLEILYPWSEIPKRTHQILKRNDKRPLEINIKNSHGRIKPWSGILVAIMFRIRATYHTTLGATPSQLVFGRSAILPIQHPSRLELYQEQETKLIDNNTVRKNKISNSSWV